MNFFHIRSKAAYVRIIYSQSRYSFIFLRSYIRDTVNVCITAERVEVVDMLTQQGLDDVTTSSVPEQVAFLLVERAKLLDALENEVCTFSYLVIYVAVKFF